MSTTSTIKLKKVRRDSESTADAVRVTLFADERGRPCGWYLGPVRFSEDGIQMAYLPRSERTLASVAVIRAIDAAEAAGLALCVVDPDDLWSDAWRA